MPFPFSQSNHCRHFAWNCWYCYKYASDSCCFSLQLLDSLVASAVVWSSYVTATDPLAVGALLYGDKKVKDRTKLLIEGESILNDDFVITVFGVLLLILFGNSTVNLSK